MDFQSSQYASSFPGFSTSASHLGQTTTHSPQQNQFFNSDPQARFAQSNNTFSYGGLPNGGQGASFPNSMQSGTMMQPGAAMSQSQLHQARAAQLQQQQQQQQQQHNPYSSAPYSQTLPSPAHQQFAQNRQTASPALSNQGQPYATPQPQQSPTTLPSSNGQQQPMNLNLPSQVKSEPAQAQTPVKAVPQSPVSPATPAKAHERVAVLLEINSILINEATTLMTQGKGGQIGAPEEGKQQPSKEYIDYVRRLQANLSYLAQNAEKVPKPGQPIQPGPAIMSAPATHEELGKLYLKLQGLFPGWKGGQPPARQSPSGPQRMNSNTSQPPNSAGLQQNWGQNPMQMQQQQQPKMEPPQ